MQSHSMRRDSHPTASKGKAKLGAQRNNKERLLTGSHHIRSYGSVVCSEARQTSMVTEEVSAGNLEVQNLRRLTAREVTLPPVKWYRQIRIPGITTKWSSPYSNAVHTTKYTILNFLFKNLWEQFHRVANIYFLFVALLNFVPAVEAFAKEIGFIPLLFVLTVTAVKDIFEDYRRYKSDKEVNSRITKVYDWDRGGYVERKWSEVCVGDFIQLSCDEVIPADILLLHSSDPDGTCYIETANIDGETNLKQRQVALGAVETGGISDSGHFNPVEFTGELYCEQPHNVIYEFSGYILQQSGRRIGVNRANLLLRGCVLRNTDFVSGIVVYAGHETKALLNNSGPRIKRSKLERDINAEVISQFAILLIICLIGGIGSGVWTQKHVDRNIVYFPYTSSSAKPALEGFVRFWTFIIIFQVIIPISLYVSMEIVKFIQVFFINWDIDMYYAPTDRPFQCRALNINEDLGQIHYVFTDKTGTLTENQMVFRCCSIGGKNYPHSLEAEFVKYKHGDDLVPVPAAVEETDFPEPPEQPLQLDSALQSDLADPDLYSGYLHDFFVVMAICNTVVVGRRAVMSEEGEGEESLTIEEPIVYEAESPDEAALVEAARSYGYTLVSRSSGECSILTPDGREVRYEVLHILEFDPVRKCMSIIVRESEDSRIILYSKGADSAIYHNLAHHSGLLPKVYHESYVEGTPTRAELNEQHLNMYARLGLRTLCMARRVLPKEEYSVWLEQRQQAEVALEGREKLLFDSALEIEKNLELLGATGIEDRLQDGVPEAIQNLRSAGIKIWVLTGDKQETAINIGYSSRLIDQEMDIIVINATSMEECQEILQSRKHELDSQEEVDERSNTGSTESTILAKMSPLLRMPPLRQYLKIAPPKSLARGSVHKEYITSHFFTPSRPLLGIHKCDNTNYHRVPKALVIDGPTLLFALSVPLKPLFLDIAKRCRSVICCRVAPLQKAAVVELVKVKLRQMTLAIGDGANDVSMIQKADVGVGIAGREGMQAVMSSDFAMGRFRFLEKLLLVHGHWCYTRLARMMLYFFYKNVAFAVLIFWFQLFNAFSGSNPIDGINLLIFNLIYTGLPIIVVAITEQDLRSDTLLADHVYYEEGRCSKVYTRWKFWLTMLEAFYQSAVVFFVAYGAYYNLAVGITEFGFVVNLSIVLTVSLHLAVETLHWTVINHIVLWGSILVTFCFNLVYTAIDTRQRFMDTYWLMYQTTSRSQFWFVLILVPMIALFPRMVAKVIEYEVFPSPVLKARIEEKQIQWKSKRTKTTHVDVLDASGAQNHCHPL